MGFLTTKKNYTAESKAINLRNERLHSEEYDPQSFGAISRNNHAALNQAKLRDIYSRLNELFGYFGLPVEESFEWNKEFTQAFLRGKTKSESGLKNLDYPIEFLNDETVIIPIYGSAGEKFIRLGSVQVDFTGKKRDVYSNNFVEALVNQKIAKGDLNSEDTEIAQAEEKLRTVLQQRENDSAFKGLCLKIKNATDALTKDWNITQTSKKAIKNTLTSFTNILENPENCQSELDSLNKSKDEIERPMPGWQIQGTITAIILMAIMGFLIGAGIDGTDLVIPTIGAFVGSILGFLSIPFSNFFIQLTNPRPNDKQNIENVIEHVQSLQVELQRQFVFTQSYQETPDVLPSEYANALQQLQNFGNTSQPFGLGYPAEPTNGYTVITHSFVQQPGFVSPYLAQPVAHFDGYASQSQQPSGFQPTPYDWQVQQQPMPSFGQSPYYIPEQGQGVYPTPPETVNPYGADYYTIVNSPVFGQAVPQYPAAQEYQYAPGYIPSNTK